jgi:predicted GNAT superfamily acetyltransferase
MTTQTPDVSSQGQFHIEPVDPADLKVLKALEEIQASAWEKLPDRDIVPSPVLEIVAETGGQLLMARTDDTNKIIGFSLAFLAKNDSPEKHLGIPNDELFLASHMVAVLPQYQGGIGYALKQAQKNFSLRRGIRWMQWTYYPMLGKNASLNLRKVGARCYKFVRNKYGELRGGLYEGLPSDRLVVLWDMQHQEPARFSHEAISLTRSDKEWRPVLDESALSEAASGSGLRSVICSIPTRFGELRRRDLEAALAWQETFAQVASTLFNSQADWAITNFRLSEDKSLGEYLFVRI